MAAMSLSNMLNMLRRRLKDNNQSAWSSPQDFREELNKAASRVVRLLQKREVINFDSVSEDITTLANTTAYPLSSTTTRSLRKMMQVLDGDFRVPCVQIPDTAYDWRTLTSRNRYGHWHYYLTRTSSTGVYVVNFTMYQQAGLTFRVYNKVVLTELATDGSDDGISFTQIPEDYHELVVQEAVMTLMDTSSSLFGGASRIYRLLTDDLIGDVSVRNEPKEILQE